jgi:hypothetical protein
MFNDHAWPYGNSRYNQEKNLLHLEHHSACVCIATFQLLKKSAYFHEIWYGGFAIGGHSIVV